MLVVGFSIFILFAGLYILGLHINNGLFEDFPQYSKNLGYPVKSYNVITDDGYILTFFRLQKKGTTTFKQGLKPVIFQHGLLDSADTWITNGNFDNTDIAPAYHFADRDFDVWVTNSRGNYYSRNHISLDPDRDAKFWNYSFVEMGMHDMPAIFKFIANETNQKINYIGHSQGGALMFAALAKREPTIVQNLDHFVALAPAVYLTEDTSPLFQAIDADKALDIYEWFEEYEMYPRGTFNKVFSSAICTYLEHLCALSNGLFSNGDNELINVEQQDVINWHFPSGTSVKSMRHLDFFKTSGIFAEYDYLDDDLNTQHYGTVDPPILDLTKIEEKILIFGGDVDLLVKVNDIQRIKNDMGDKAEVIILEKFGHSIFKDGTDMSYLSGIVDFFKGTNTTSISSLHT